MILVRRELHDFGMYSLTLMLSLCRMLAKKIFVREPSSLICAAFETSRKIICYLKTWIKLKTPCVFMWLKTWIKIKLKLIGRVNGFSLRLEGVGSSRDRRRAFGFIHSLEGSGPPPPKCVCQSLGGSGPPPPKCVFVSVWQGIKVATKPAIIGS